jgi:CDP-diacylglycerol--serine O-phosphatidyltransferase
MCPLIDVAGMSFEVRRRLGVADAVTLANATLGVVAMIVALVVGPGLAARLILFAAIADGLDGIIARRYGGTTVGPYLDAMADTVSFGAAPALFVFAATSTQITAALPADLPWPELLAVLVGSAVPSILVVFSLVRTAMYTVHVDDDRRRPGVQNTLVASILAAGYLAGVTDATVLLAGAVLLSVLMVAPVPYPKLRARDALGMGAVQMGAVIAPAALGRAFPRVLLLAALAYLTLAPRYYWE